jgi:hemerythrin-like domain-containing protein
VCEYCGCRQVPPIAELMAEHDDLVSEGDLVLRALAAGDREQALSHLERLVAHLAGHVAKEERGLFTALRDQQEYVDEVEALEQEHVSFDVAVAALEPGEPGFDDRVKALLTDLDHHVDRENVGIFPVSVVTLGARGWERVDRARQEHPTWVAHAHPH